MNHDTSNVGWPNTFAVYLLISESIVRNIEKDKYRNNQLRKAFYISAQITRVSFFKWLQQEGNPLKRVYGMIKTHILWP